MRTSARICMSVALTALFMMAPPCGFAKPPAASGSIEAISKALETRPPNLGEVNTLASYVKTHPSDAQAHYLMGRVYEYSGYFDLAVEEFKKSWALKKDGKTLEALAAMRFKLAQGPSPAELTEMAATGLSKDFDSLIQTAAIMQAHYYFQEADRLYALAGRLRPNAPELACARAYTALAQRDFKSALAEAEKAMSSPKTRYTALVVKGQALIGMKRIDDAANILRVAFEEEPTNVDVDELLFKALVVRGRYTEALEPGLFALALTSDDRLRNWAVKSDLIKVVRHTNPKEIQPVVDHVGEKLAGSNVSAKFHFALGDVYDRVGYHDLALAQFKAGTALDTEGVNGRAYMRIGKVLELHKRDYKGAMENYERAYMLNPSDKEIAARRNILKRTLYSGDNDIAFRLKNWVYSTFAPPATPKPMRSQ